MKRMENCNREENIILRGRLGESKYYNIETIMSFSLEKYKKEL